MIMPTVQASSRYQFKPERYSSHQLLLDALSLEGRGLRVLDAGCAGGYLSEVLAGRGFEVTAIDLPGSEASDDLHRPRGVEFIAADLNDGLPALCGRFDFILCADVLEHLRDPLALLRDCRKCLADGGALLASLPNSGHAYFRWNVLMGRFPQHDLGLFDRTHLRFYTWDGWVELLHRGGFRIERTVCSGVPIGRALPAWMGTAKGSAAIGMLERLSFESARVWKRLFAYQFIVLARGAINVCP
jgi:SAM-dependent methyltransferase